MRSDGRGCGAAALWRISLDREDINDEDFMTLMAEDGETREDLKLPPWPEVYAAQLREEFASGKQLLLTVLKACGTEQVMSHKVDTE